MDALPYIETPLPVLLPLSAFLLALHIVAWPIDRLFSCGLLGQMLVGTIWGPVTSWLDLDIQRAVVNLGYVGLILLVYEGGLTTDIKLLRETYVYSILVAVTGVLFPIAFSFLLIPITSQWIPIGPLTAFAAGASLASTSLGTTYAVLLGTGLTKTRVGTILSTAAMLDDVVGLVMFKVISSLATSVSAQAVVRPIAVSVGFLLLALLATKPLKSYIIPQMKRITFIESKASGFVLTGVTIMGLIAAAGYAGTSVLFVGYLTGVSASYLFQEGALECYEMFYHPVTKGLLLPFFFASIGFAIPIRELFDAGVVWRGVVYSILMALGKCATGLWLIVPPAAGRFIAKIKKTRASENLELAKHFRTQAQSNVSSVAISAVRASGDDAITTAEVSSPVDTSQFSPDSEAQTTSSPANPSSEHGSFQAALLLSVAMTTRGEIGFLIAAVAQSSGILVPTEIYLIVMWAIVLCTLAGPVGVGIIVRRLGRMPPARRDQILGIWA